MLAFIQHLDPLSPWLLGVIFIAVLSAVIEAGYQTARKIRSDRDLDKHPIETSVTGTVTGLLAFMLAFTFGTSVSRYSDVRSLALADTIAVENAYSQADFLPDADRTTTRQLLLEYHRIRLEALGSGDQSKIAVAVQRSSEIQDKLWAIAVHSRTEIDSSSLNPFVNAIGELSNAHTRRVHKAMVARLAPVIWACLLLLAILSSFLLGMTSGFHGRRSRFAATFMLIAICSVFVLIIDLDRPVRSLFEMTDNTAQALLEKMERDSLN